VADTETNIFFFADREALVLSGGGARGAYQVGVLKAIAEWLPANVPCPFEVLVGTSAGALNAAALAAGAANLQEAVRTLERVWENFTVDQVIRVDNLTMIRGALQWLISLLSAGWMVRSPRSLLDNSPLRDLIARTIPLEQIRKSIVDGPIHALAVATTSYSTGQAVAFFEALPSLQEWNRVSRAGVRRAIDLDVLMASAAIPFIFPATSVDGRHYGDGSMRQLAPLSPAVHLGANRVLVIGTRGQPAPLAREQADVPPSLGHLLGFVLDALFTDGLSIDLERLRQVNRLLQLGFPGRAQGWRPFETCVIEPSVDPTALARQHERALPRSLRALLRTMGAMEARGGLLLSYLLFEGIYTRELIALGYADAQRHRDEVERLLGPRAGSGAAPSDRPQRPA